MIFSIRQTLILQDESCRLKNTSRTGVGVAAILADSGKCFRMVPSDRNFPGQTEIHCSISSSFM